MTFASLSANLARYARTQPYTASGLAGYGKGLGLCLLISCFALLIEKRASMIIPGLSPIVIAMLAGIALGNLGSVSSLASLENGIRFTKQKLLRLGIVLFGFRLTLGDLQTVGLAGVVIDALVLVSTLALAYLIGRRVFGLDRSAVLLAGAGSAICGAAAILATEPVVKGRPEQVSIAVASIVLFGTCATLIYPLLYHFNPGWQFLPSTDSAFGIYVGSTIHEMAQVAAASQMIGVEVMDSAIVAKMVRVMMLPAFLIMLSMLLMRRSEEPNMKRDRGTAHFLRTGAEAIPWFAVGFMLALILNSLTSIPEPVRETMVACGNLFLIMAMTALGLGTRMSAFNRTGLKLVALSGLLFLWLMIGGAAINHVVLRFL